MPPISTLASALSGMIAAARRAETIASNVANAETVGRLTPDGGGDGAYRALDVRQTTGADGGVVATVTERSPAVVPQADPGSPLADADGLVAAPNVDVVGEMVDLVGARIAYEASAKVMQSTQKTVRRALDTMI